MRASAVKRGVKGKTPAFKGRDETLLVGGRIRHLRRSRHLLLADLAEMAGCSESLLSRIENDRATPSLSTLHRVCRALDTNVSALLGGSPSPSCVVYEPGERRRLTADAGVEGDGSSAESLVPYTECRLLQGFVMILPPGGALCGPFRHSGEEVGYVLNGELELTVGEDIHKIGPDGSFFFRSDTTHTYRASGDSFCRVVWINTPPTFRPQSRASPCSLDGFPYCQ